jgi:transposase
MSERRKKRDFSEEFKRQMVGLYNAGKTQGEICREYDLTPSALRNWVSRINRSGSSKIADNRTEAEKHLIGLLKENKQLKMENDILKQAALIFARRS